MLLLYGCSRAKKAKMNLKEYDDSYHRLNLRI